MSRRITLIINPISGVKKHTGLIPRLEQELTAMGFDLSVRPTQYAGHAEAIAREAADAGFYAVIACGGDGTVNETARALTGTRTILGILPKGSGNGLARHINIPCDPIKALEIIRKDHPQDCDWCEADGHPFFCSFGVGFDADVAHRFAGKGRRGLRTYIQSAMEEYRVFRPSFYRVETEDGGSWEGKALLLTCCNASQYGNNTYIAPSASIRDGLIDLTIVAESSLLSYSRMGIGIFAGTLHDSRHVRMFKTPSLKIIREAPGHAHIDGDPVEMGREITVTLHRAGLRIFTNPDKRPFRPILTPLLGK